MAIIGKIREKSTLVLIIIGGAIMAFVLSDLFSSGATGPQRPINLAEVNGEIINPQEFDLRLQKAFENYRQQTQEENIDERTKANIREQVWNDILSDILLGSQMEELGLTVTTKELFDMMQGQNPHPQVRQAFSDPETGEFNPSVVVNFLQNLDSREPEVKQQWVDFEKALKRNQKFDKYYALTDKGLYYPAKLAEKAYLDNQTSISFQYAYIPFNSIPDSTISVSESEMEDYYDDHLSEFETEASTKITYAFFPVDPSAADRENAKQWAEKIYREFQTASNDSIFVNANSDQRFDPVFYSRETAPSTIDTSMFSKEVGYVEPPKLLNDIYYISKVKAKKLAPDSVKASHILINTQQQTVEKAEKLADSLMALIAEGADLGALAVEFSDDQATAADSGNVGWFTEGKMVKPFNDSAFAAELGEVKKAQSQFGFHLIEVKERTEIKEKIQVATVIREILPSKETYADVFNEANSFSIDVNDVNSFNEQVEAKNVQKRTVVLQENDNLIQGLSSSRGAVRWVREADQGAVSEAFDVGEGFAVILVEVVNEDGPAPFEQVKNRLEFLVRQNKKAEQLKEKMSGFSSLAEIAGSLDLSIENVEDVNFSSPAIPNIGLEPKLVGKAFTIEADQLSEPIQGNNGVFVIKVTEKISPEEVNIAQIRNVFSSEKQTIIRNGGVFNAIKEKADLTDNRSKFY